LATDNEVEGACADIDEAEEVMDADDQAEAIAHTCISASDAYFAAIKPDISRTSHIIENNKGVACNDESMSTVWEQRVSVPSGACRKIPT
jgi:hypothetical protein